MESCLPKIVLEFIVVEDHVDKHVDLIVVQKHVEKHVDIIVVLSNRAAESALVHTHKINFLRFR